MTEPCRCPQSQHDHGTYLRYTKDQCRCAPCRAANRARQRRQRKLTAMRRTVSPIDARTARRMLQALQAIGWSIRYLATQTRISERTLSEIARSENERVTPATMQEVRRIYGIYAYTPPNPKVRRERESVTKTRMLAASRDYVSAFAWDDIEHDHAPLDGSYADSD